MRILYIVLFLCHTFVSGCAQASVKVQHLDCTNDSALQIESSKRLKLISQEDQSDRLGPFDSIDWHKLSLRDAQRRSEVDSMFANGCLQTGEDYAAAAMIYQHGVTADHYYQAFIWANKAFTMGVESQRWWVAATLDRYLVNIGHKQLFGTQLSKPSGGGWCFEPIESTFPKVLRLKYVGLSVKEQIARTIKGTGLAQSPNDVKDCKVVRKNSPAGTVPGFW